MNLVRGEGGREGGESWAKDRESEVLPGTRGFLSASK